MAIPAGISGYVGYTDIIRIEIVDAVLAAIEDFGCGDLQRVCPLVPGEIVWDACDCGSFAQTITSTFPSNSFPAPATDTRQTACGPNLIVVNVTAELVRCAPMIDDAGQPPTCAALEDSALTLECDRQALRQAITCTLRELRAVNRIIDFTVGVATTVGPQGGCVGVSLPYQLGVPNVCC